MSRYLTKVARIRKALDEKIRNENEELMKLRVRVEEKEKSLGELKACASDDYAPASINESGGE